MAEQFRVTAFARVVAQLRESAVIIDFTTQVGPSPKELVQVALQDADSQFKELKLSPLMRAQWERLLKRAQDDAPMTELAILIRELNDNLMVELSSAFFLMIPADRRFVYAQPTPIFGEHVEKAFPDARSDIAAAGRCYALDEWTACVFHLMRA